MSGRHGAADALRTALGTPLPPVERPGHATTMQATRAALGEAAFERAWVAGRRDGVPRIAITATLTE
ncbi:MAG: hypothetical protein IT340_00675 [Chloroflexi bacterium]|nr:hypothetical protein [Chloroflexota bacterium]